MRDKRDYMFIYRCVKFKGRVQSIWKQAIKSLEARWEPLNDVMACKNGGAKAVTARTSSVHPI